MPLPLPLLNPKIDVVFKALLQDLPDAIADMIECVVDLPGPIASLTVLNRDAPLVHPEDKQAVLDVLVEIAGFGRVNVEMQRAHHADNPARFLYYWAKEYGRTLKRGASYRDLHPVVSILWLDHLVDPEGPFHSIYRVREETTHRIYSPNLEIHTLELPKWLNAYGNQRSEVRGRLDRWSCLFADPDQARALLKKGDTIMERVMVKLEHISQEETLRILAENRERDEEFHEWSLRNQLRQATEVGKREGLEAGMREGLEAGMREGLEAGMREGLEAGKREALLSLLAQRFGDLPGELIGKIAKTDGIELDAMMTRLLTARTATDVLR
jgi:predicted transposase/invertase (TIGR01784 family)